MKYKYRIEGMHCNACIAKIKDALAQHYVVETVTREPPQLIIEAQSPPDLSALNRDIASAGAYHVQSVNKPAETKTSETTSYYPIYLITFYIVLVTALNNIHPSSINWERWMHQFMAGFFLVFSAFKFLDLRGFAEGYATYDLLAKHWKTYGLIYPFLELLLGILYLTEWFLIPTYLFTIVLMGFSSLGVIVSLIKRQQIQCACLGTLLKVPLSSITLIEDLVMVGMAAVSLMMQINY